MCTDHSLPCNCGKQRASLMFRDDVLPEKAINGLYCPECAAAVEFDPRSMIADNGWIIDYDMAVAEYYISSRAGEVEEVTPEVIFDDCFATWLGMYPGDHTDSMEERAELTELARSDMSRYLTDFREWGKKRMERLKAEGWRKAQV